MVKLLVSLGCFFCLFSGFCYASYPLNLSEENIKLPRTNDEFLANVLYNRRTIYYKLPQVYQFHNYPHTTNYGIYYTDFLKDFNANLDFPWETTVGLNTAHKKGNSPYETFNFMLLPENAPVLVISNEFPLKWIYPENTIVGEIIYVNHEGQKYVQEVRTRQKEKGSIIWEPKIFRPLASREEYIRFTNVFPYEPLSKHFFFRNLEEDEVFKMEGTIEKLPKTPEDRVKAILSLPFKDVTKSKWVPMAEQAFDVVPQDYSLGLLKPSRFACMDCHRQTQIRVNNLIPREPLIRKNPDKIGRIRGSDGIFTWYPFADSSIHLNEKACPDSSSVNDRRWYKDNELGVLWRHNDGIDENSKLDTNRNVLWRKIENPRISLRDFDRRNNIVREYYPQMKDENGDVRINGHLYRLTEAVEKSLMLGELPEKEFLHDKKKEK